MNKKELRKHYKKLRQNLSLDTIEDQSLAIANTLLKLPIWNKNYYHIFLSIKPLREINTEFILNILSGKDKNIIIPKTDFDNNSMSHYLLTDSTILKINQWNITEPVDGVLIPEHMINVVFIPLLAFDKKGNRVGYGKGFYDHFLNRCNPDTIKIGLSLFEAEDRIIDVSDNDIPLDFCVTPSKVYTFHQEH
ncbi:MAG: 5-formyltetrahydrofolate cyclo-ligase [Flavobacteriaceae bacterium]|nr:5-formyltetrahydrofolate cyclo-ligase [Flavobacteriaceae bacterium]